MRDAADRRRLARTATLGAASAAIACDTASLIAVSRDGYARTVDPAPPPAGALRAFAWTLRAKVRELTEG